MYMFIVHVIWRSRFNAISVVTLQTEKVSFEGKSIFGNFSCFCTCTCFRRMYVDPMGKWLCYTALSCKELCEKWSYDMFISNISQVFEDHMLPVHIHVFDPDNGQICDGPISKIISSIQRNIHAKFGAFITFCTFVQLSGLTTFLQHSHNALN